MDRFYDEQCRNAQTFKSVCKSLDKVVSLVGGADKSRDICNSEGISCVNCPFLASDSPFVKWLYPSVFTTCLFDHGISKEQVRELLQYYGVTFLEDQLKEIRKELE